MFFSVRSVVFLFLSSAVFFGSTYSVFAQGPVSVTSLCGTGEFARVTSSGLVCSTLTTPSESSLLSITCTTGEYLSLGRATDLSPVLKCLSLPAAAVPPNHRLLPSSACASGETIQFNSSRIPECIATTLQGPAGPAGPQGLQGPRGSTVSHLHAVLSSDGHSHASQPVPGGTCPVGQCIYKINSDGTVACRGGTSAITPSPSLATRHSLPEKLSATLSSSFSTPHLDLTAQSLQTSSLCLEGEFVRITANGLVCSSIGLGQSILSTVTCSSSQYLTLGRDALLNPTLRCQSLPTVASISAHRILPSSACATGQTVQFTSQGDVVCGALPTPTTGPAGAKGVTGKKGPAVPPVAHAHDGLASHSHSHLTGEVTIAGGSCVSGQCAYALNTDGTVSCRSITGGSAGTCTITAASIPSQAVSVDSTISLDVLSYFTATQCGTVTYSSSVSSTSIATADGLGAGDSTFILTGVAKGSTSVEVTATSGSVSASDTFTITVADSDGCTIVPSSFIPDFFLPFRDVYSIDFSSDFTTNNCGTISYSGEVDPSNIASVVGLGRGDGAGRILTSNKAGSAVVTITATSQDGFVNAYQAFTLTVE